MEPQSELLKINKNEYLAQQKSKLEDALEMGLTKDEYNLICEKIDKIPNITELGIFLPCFQNIALIKVQKMVKNFTNRGCSCDPRAWRKCWCN